MTFQMSISVKPGFTNIARKRLDIFMLDFKMHFEVMTHCRFVAAHMTYMKFSFTFFVIWIIKFPREGYKTK